MNTIIKLCVYRRGEWNFLYSEENSKSELIRQ